MFAEGQERRKLERNTASNNFGGKQKQKGVTRRKCTATFKE